MATISGAANEKVYSIPRWLGLNEHPDGDTRLKMGEAAEMVNWKITRDGNLKRRPGTRLLSGLRESYTIVRGDNLLPIGSFEDGDMLEVYGSADPDFEPGAVSLIGESSNIEKGEIVDPNGTVGAFTETEGEARSFDGGVYSPGLDYSVRQGVLIYGSAGAEHTMAELAEVLAALADGEFLYAEIDEKYYALGNQSMRYDSREKRWALSGFRIVSTADDGNGNPVPAKPVDGLWTGIVQRKTMVLAACDGKLWSLYDDATDTWGRTEIVTPEGFVTENGVHFFPFGENVFILNGEDYYMFDGSTLSVVDGYRPLVAIAIGPVVDGGEGASSGVTTTEYVNRLNGKRRVWISPEGGQDNPVFQMPEKDLDDDNPVTVIDLRTGEPLQTTAYTVDYELGKVTLIGEIPKGVNSYEIQYDVPGGYDPMTGMPYGYMALREQVMKERFSELYSGSTDTMIFLYGDGTNRTIYSGMDYDGMPRADYFPDTHEARVGEENTPITSMIRHYGDLVAFKTDSAWSLSYTMLDLPDEEGLIPAVYVTPVNREKGNLAPGQVRLVDNNPVTCSGKELYQWINSSYYSSNISRDERQARRISDRIQRSVKELDFRHCIMWDDNDNQEFYVCDNGVALVWNYAADAWYRYEGFDARCMASFRGELLIGTSDGCVLLLSYDETGDCGDAIGATWKSGAMSFGSEYSRKYSSMMWVGLKPEDGTAVDVTVVTDRKNTFRDKVVSSSKAKVASEPFMVRTKIKAKKFVYYRLVLEAEKLADGTADKLEKAVTVNSVDFRVRMTGYTK